MPILKVEVKKKMHRPNSPQLWKPKNLIFPISEYLKYWCKPSNLQGAQVGWGIIFLVQFSLVQLLSRVWLFATPWTAARQASLSITDSWACSNSCPLSRWCHPTVSSSVIPFSCLQSFLASGSFPMRQLFTSGGQSTGVSASAAVLPVNTQDWFPLAWTG